MGFNQAQLKAIDHLDGNLLIVAGPGTGKTHTIAHKIARVMGKWPKLRAENVFAITFTTKAAKQLKERLGDVMGSDRLPFVGTFHALCYNLIQQAFRALGIDHTLHVLGEKERNKIISEICLSLDPDIKKKKIRDYEMLISTMKNRLIEPKNLEEMGENGIFARIFEAYERALDERMLLDFDDLICKMVKLLEAHPQIKAAINNALEWLFIDEFQDINGAQYQLIQSLVGPQTRVCAIGDPDQAIYGFRGSDVKYFWKFEQDFPGTTVITLEQNYRSTPQILNVANELIAHNKERAHKSLHTTAEGGQTVQLAVFEDQWKEAGFIAREISKLMGGTDMTQTDAAFEAFEEAAPVSDGAEREYHFSDFAVLYRTKSQGKLIEEAFKKAGIPYQMVAQIPWHQESEIQLLLNCFRTIVDGNFSTGEHDTDFLCNHVARIRGEITYFKPAQIAVKIIDLLHLDAPTESAPMQVEKRISNLENFKAVLHEFDDLVGADGLTQALEHFALLQEQDLYDERMQAVSLMTIHAAKGLEFPIVFVAGLDDGLLPYSQDSKEELEEERRLFYVAVTRAKEKLYLLRAKKRGQEDAVPSPFIDEIRSFIDFKEIATRRARSIVDESQTSFL